MWKTMEGIPQAVKCVAYLQVRDTIVSSILPAMILATFT